MSLRVLTLVWEHAKAEGGDLLVLLALADEARDNGGCYPGIDRIAAKARMTERNVRYVLRRLEQSGELVVVPGGGRANTNLYEIRVTPNLELTLQERGQIFPKPGKTAPKRGQSATETLKPSAPEPLDLKATEGLAGQGKPSPVASLFKAYQDGIRRLYGAEYPPGPKANGQLAQVVKNLGAQNAAGALAFYLASRKPYYATRKHALDVFVRDAADLHIEAQQVTAGASRSATPVKAIAYLEHFDGEAPVRMAEYPAGDPLAIAKAFAREYASKVERTSVSCVMIRQGAAERRFKPEELR